VLRETLSEATQSERLQKKNAMQSFFKSTKAKIEETKLESKDTLIYFSSVDLLFSEDEGFWRALKSFIDKTKGVIVIFIPELRLFSSDHILRRKYRSKLGIKS
jgi:hypothetical protein